MIRLFLDLLFPPRCLVCREPGEEILCPRCRLGFNPVPPPVCARCGTPLGAGVVTTCPACRDADPPYALARAMGVYAGTLRSAIWRLKFDGRRELGVVLGRLLAGFVRDMAPLRAVDLVVPVPLHEQRQRARGYNQAGLIADSLAEALGLPLAAALDRSRQTAPQRDLGRQERRANVRGAFGVSARCHEILRGRAVLLVDDVLTSGATAAECAAALRGAGAAAVHVAALARAVLPTREPSAGVGGD